MICLTTASSAAAFSTNIHDANKKFGIDKKLVEFGIPIGQVLFMPGFVALLFVLSVGFANSYGIPMEVMGVALAVNAITDFPCTTCNISGWQLTMIDVADSLGMLDREVLHKKENNTKNTV